MENDVLSAILEDIIRKQIDLHKNDLPSKSREELFIKECSTYTEENKDDKKCQFCFFRFKCYTEK